MKINKTKTLYRDESKCFFASLSLLIIVFGLYMYFVSMSVVHVVMRKEVNQQIIVVNSQISELESQYINAQHGVSVEIASMQGFVKVENKIFLDRTSTNVALSQSN